MFEASHSQERRLKWPSTQRIFGWCCSSKCLSEMGVRSRIVSKRLSPRKLAYSRLNNAVECGKLKRPSTCERCGCDPGVDRLGRSKIEGHHKDHAKALEVEWLCDKCHKAITPRARGERNNASVFTRKQVVAIRRAYKNGYPGYRLAEIYGVTGKAVYDILNRKTWGWL